MKGTERLTPSPWGNGGFPCDGNRYHGVWEAVKTCQLFRGDFTEKGRKENILISDDSLGLLYLYFTFPHSRFVSPKELTK